MNHWKEIHFESFCSYLRHRIESQFISEIYIYGIGIYAQKLIDYFKKTEIKINGLINDIDIECCHLSYDFPIYNITEILNIPKTIIVALRDEHESVYEYFSAMNMPETKIIKLFEKVSIDTVKRFAVNIEHKYVSQGVLKTVFYIGNNTDVDNFGCRATSKALYDIISHTITITDSLHRNEILELFAAIPMCSDLFQYAHMIKTYNRDVWDSMILRIIKADAIVLNGEGSFIFQSPPRIDLHNYLILLLICIETGKPFFILNAMFTSFADKPININLMDQCLSILSVAHLVTARDKFSIDFINKYNKNINIKYVPDALFSWYNLYEKKSSDFQQIQLKTEFVMPFDYCAGFNYDLDFNDEYILMSGNSLAAHNRQQAYECFTSLAIAIQKLSKKYSMKFYMIVCCSGDKVLRNIAIQTGIPIIPVEVNIYFAGYLLSQAACFISGRYHPSILASLGGTPCVFMGSNSHKTSSLQEVLDIPINERKTFSALPNSNEINEIVSFTEYLLDSDKYIDRRRKIKETCENNMNLVMKIDKYINQEIRRHSNDY